MHALKLRNHWNYDAYFPFSFKFGSTPCYFSVRGASFCVLGMVILSTKPHLGHFGQQISLHIFAILRIFHLTHGRYYYMFSRVRRASGGVGWVGVGEVITFVGTFTHIPCYMFSRDAGHLVLGTFELPVFSNQSSHPLGQGMRTRLNPMAQGTTN